MRWSDLLKFSLVFAALLWACIQARGQDNASGFASQLNAVRASRGLPGPVTVSAETAAISSRNNAWQRVRGLGHWDTGGLAQCAAIGCGDTTGALAMWLSSPPHAAILLHAGLTSVGYHGDGWAATVACSMGTSTPTVGHQPQGYAALPPAVGAGCHPRRFKLFHHFRR